MKKYKLLKDLPTYKAGEMFYLDEGGNLCASEAQGFCKLVAYKSSTLKKFPNLFDDWFEEVDEGAPWREPEGGSYYYVDGDIMIGYTVDQRLARDDARYEAGNYYETEAEAAQAIAKSRAYVTIKRDAKGFRPDWNDLSQVKWYVACDRSDGCLYTTGTRWTQELGQIYFATEEDALCSIKTHRPELELLFDIDLDKEETNS